MPYPVEELNASRSVLQRSDVSDVGLQALQALRPQLDAQATRLFPYDPRFVPRDKDLFDLFDYDARPHRGRNWATCPNPSSFGTTRLSNIFARDQMRKDARDEATLSGELRRAIHASQLSLADIATRVGITTIMLDDFLTGERTLRSDVLDRLADALGYELPKTN